jgi:hypothetical protein
MGRNSVEATKARLSSAVLAAAAARAARLTALLLFFLAGFVDFVALCVLDEDEGALCGCGESPEDCPTAGGTTIRTASAQARHRTSGEAGFEEVAAFISFTVSRFFDAAPERNQSRYRTVCANGNAQAGN